MEPLTTTVVLHEKLLDVLRYFGIFQYPLTLSEIATHCSVPVAREDVAVALQWLCEQEQVFSFGGYFSRDKNIEAQVHRRQEGNRLAAQRIDAAARTGRFLYQFPFVRFVGISGSLSKGFSVPRGDFDFFIITAHQRLWVCRTLLHLFKKVTFLVGRQHCFCMNYFVDIGRLQLGEQNVFTAIELSSLIPVAGSDTHESLLQENGWAKSFLPNEYLPFLSVPVNDRKLRLATGLEFLLSWCGAGINKALMHMTDKRWRRKWKRKNYPQQDYDLAFKTTLFTSKNHPANYQKKILQTLRQDSARNKNLPL